MRTDTNSAGGDRPAVHRLGPADLAVLWPEDHGWPNDVGLLAILDGTPLLDDDGRFRLDLVRQHVADRIDHLPSRFRMRMVRPRPGLGGPYWVEVPIVDVTAHVQQVALPAPASEAAVLRICERLRRGGLDRSRPLWRLSFLTGLPSGRVALFFHAHHCVVDGMSGITALAAFVDGVVAAPPSHQRRAGAAPAPSTAALLRDALRQRRAALVRTVRALAHPRRLWARAAAEQGALRRAAAGGHVTATSLTGRVGPDRHMALVRGDLSRLKAVGRARRATVNDVLLSAVAAGLRQLLLDRGEPVDDVRLRAAVPVALHDGDGGSAEGNADGGMLLDLHVDEPDHLARLGLIVARTAQQKQLGVMSGATSGIFSLAWVQRILIRLTVRQRMSSTYVANVPGPPVLLSLAGAPILEMFPVIPLIGNITVGVGALSYAGQFNLSVVADRELCPEVEAMAAAIHQALRDMAAAAALPGRPHPVPPVRHVRTSTTTTPSSPDQPAAVEALARSREVRP